MHKLLTLMVTVALTRCLWAAETGTLEEHLEPLRAFIGKTWRGEFKDSTPEKPVIDVARWERALNGQAIRIVHSINDGMYGGESILRWDKEKNALTFFYFTTAGFYTSGTITCKEGKIIGREKVSGGAGGTTEVRSIYELQKDGSLSSKAEYLKGEEVTGKREVLYLESPGAEVRFK